MSGIFSGMAGTLWPRRGGPDGPLPPLLLALTLVTGLVDAASYLKLGHVFVANMTGNVVFLGFAIAGAGGLSITSSLVALGSFLAGSAVGGRVGALLAGHRGRLLLGGVSLQILGIAAAAALAAAGDDPARGARRLVLVALLSLAMGVQNATVRRLAVPELTTTVLTMTLTGLGADSSRRSGGPAAGRRILAVGAMLVGALAGALLALRIDTAAPLVTAGAIVALTAFATLRLLRTPAAWAGEATR